MIHVRYWVRLLAAGRQLGANLLRQAGLAWLLRKRVWVGLLLLGGTLTGIILFPRRALKESGPDADVRRVTSMVLNQDHLTNGLEIMGKLSIYEKVRVSSKVSGRIKRLYKKIGDPAAAGETLFTLETMELELRRKTLSAQLSVIRAQLESARAGLVEAVRNARRAMAAIGKNKAALDNTALKYRNMKRVLRNKKKLAAIGAVTRDEMENLRVRLDSMRTELMMARKTYTMSRLGYRDRDITAQGKSVPNNPEAREELLIRLNTLGARARVTAQEAERQKARTDLEQVELMLKEAVVKAPFSGVVAARQAERGELIKDDDDVYILVRADLVYAEGGVDERQIRRVRKKQKAEVYVGALRREPFQGTVSQVHPLVDEQNRTVTVRVLLKNETNLLRPGMFARIRLHGKKTGAPGARLPREAVYRDGEKTAYVWLVRNGMVFRRQVELMDDQGDTFVCRGVARGERIVTGGTRQLQEGEMVRYD